MGSFIRSLVHRNSIQAALLLLISIAAALLAGEWIVRSLFRDSILIFPRYVTEFRYGDYRIRGNIPNAHYHHRSADGRWEFRINGNGFRSDRDFSYSKEPGVLRLLFLGDSFTLGYEVDGNQTYASVAERDLARRGIRAEAINAGISGFGTAEELVFLEWEGLRYRPDVVVLGFFWNDMGDNMMADLFRLEDGCLAPAGTRYTPAIGTRDRLNSIPLYQWLGERSYLHNYLNYKLTKLVKSRMAKKRVSAIHDRTEDRSPAAKRYKTDLAVALVGEMRRITEESGARFIVVDIPNRRLKPSLPVRNEEERAGIAPFYLDSSRYLRDYSGEALLYRPHGLHWTETAHRIVGLELGRMIAEESGAATARDSS